MESRKKEEKWDKPSKGEKTKEMKVQATETRPILIDEVKKSLPTPSTLQKFEVQP